MPPAHWVWLLSSRHSGLPANLLVLEKMVVKGCRESLAKLGGVGDAGVRVRYGWAGVAVRSGSHSRV